MSQQLINHSPDLKRLQDEGYEVEIRSTYLLLRNVPYLNSRREIKFGTIVSDLTLAGEQTTTPADHVVRFSGEYPCHNDGSQMSQIVNESVEKTLDQDLVVQHSFSSKPVGGYKDYHHKMTAYVAMIMNPALSIDPNLIVKTFPVICSGDENSPFHYRDTASSRADIVAVTRKLNLFKVAIVGLGGTGSYVLDLVAKTPVKEIHLFDSDVFLQHNAFRAPGAASLETLKTKPKKVNYLSDLYSKMHKGIIPHEYVLNDSNADELKDADFVFLCIDGGESKKHIIEKLEELDIPFVDTGMGVNLVDDQLYGTVRLTTSTAQKRDHLRSKVGFSNDGDNDYARNIQIADLNALNASFAVIRWKKLFGFYKDYGSEHHCLYDTDGNIIHNEDTL